MKKSLLLLPLVLVCASVPAVVHADAGADESGCRDVVVDPAPSSANWSRLLERVEQSGDGSLLRPYGPARPVYQDTGVASGQVQLAAASCTDVVYSATVARAVPDGAGGFTTGEVLTTLAQRGDGTSSRVSLRGILDLAEDCVQVALTTANPGGKVIDRAPDAGEVTICNGGAGGQTFGS